jgi:RNA polymerase sigma-54 factor
MAVSPSSAQYVIPDVFVRKIDNRWQVEISPTGVPRLSVNQQYARLLRGSGDHAVLRTQLQEARWLIRSLEIRNETLMKVATCIVIRQTDFLEHGDEAMKPMVLRDVAEEIGMHESTISRVTTNKYMHTPRGIFEFKYFFSSHLSSANGEDQSSTSVRAKIRKMIGAENPAKPLSDSKIAHLLAEDGISVARRTVAKYREAMQIESSSERRQRPT